MSVWTAAALLAVAAYLVGSIPFGLLIGRWRGVDIRRVGSGNIGATNVARALGLRWGAAVLALDLLKGLVPSVAAGRLLHAAAATTLPVSQTTPTWHVHALWLACGLAAVIGHMFPVYLRFRGGKGVATGLGVALGVYPHFTWPALATIAIWAAVFVASGYVSLASIAGAMSFPVLYFALAIGLERWSAARDWPLAAFAVVVPVLVVIRHRANIGRLIRGTEPRHRLRAPRSADAPGPSR